MNERPGRRERKKMQTRDEILRAGLKLFGERGYQRTTVAQIAEAADVALSTFFAYFPTKEDIVFYDFPRLQTSLASTLDQSGDVLEGFREWVRRELLEGPDTDDARAVRQLIDSDEKLLAQERQRISYFQEQFALSIAPLLGEAPDQVRPQILAGVAVGATLAALDCVRRDGEPRLALATLESVVRAALHSLQSG
jgi:AcrR family transcriptional regulator